MATSPAGFSITSRLFYVTDRTTGTRFLVDTGADVSVIPPSTAEKRKPASMILQAVNKSTISTFGEKSMTLDIGLRRSYRWIFIILISLSLFWGLIFSPILASESMFATVNSLTLLLVSLSVAFSLQQFHHPLFFIFLFLLLTPTYYKNSQASHAHATMNHLSSIL